MIDLSSFSSFSFIIFIALLATLGSSKTTIPVAGIFFQSPSLLHTFASTALSLAFASFQRLPRL